MAQPAPIGLSNPYDGTAGAPAARPSRPRPALARAAVLAGLSGAAAVGLGVGGGSSAWADSGPATTVPVSHWDGTDVSCLPERQPVTDAAAGRHVTSRAVGPVAVAGGSAAWPSRCGSPPWARPVDPGDLQGGPELVSVDGTVEAGVEPGCVVLAGTDGLQWTLTGPLRELPLDVAVTVTGTTVPDTLSTCTRGELLDVRRVELCEPGDPAGPAVPIAVTDRLAVRPAPRPPVSPACGPIRTGKVPFVALCTR